MPNVWTHICFCESVVDTLRNPDPFAKQETLMSLGAQGSTPLYFNFWRLIQNRPVKNMNLLLHDKKYNDFLLDIIESAKNERIEVQSYVFGFITNYILDYHIDPFICYFAGGRKKDQRKLETYIDTLLMEKHHNLQTWKTAVYKEIDVGFSIDKDIVDVFQHNIKKYFPKMNISNKTIQKAYRNMKFTLRLLADPYGWKNTLFGTIISPYSYQPIKDDRDYLNLNRESWYLPHTKEIKTDSFEDLYEQAKIVAIEIMTEVLTYWHQKSDIAKKNLQKLIGNLTIDKNLILGDGIFDTVKDRSTI